MFSQWMFTELYSKETKHWYDFPEHIEGILGCCSTSRSWLQTLKATEVQNCRLLFNQGLGNKADHVIPLK